MGFLSKARAGLKSSQNGTAAGLAPGSKRGFVLLTIAVALVGSGAVASVPSLRWRLQMLLLHATGGVPDVQWSDVLTFVSPGSGGYNDMARLLETHNPYAVISNPKSTPADVRAGAELFGNGCAACHGANGGGGSAAPALASRDFKHGGTDWAIYRTIKFGVQGTGMPSHANNRDELWQLVAYVRSLQTTGEAPSRTSAAVNVSYDEIRSVDEPAEDWLTFSGSYSSHRHSVLRQIDPQNVKKLSLRWNHQLDGDPGKVESSPLVRGGIMFLTVPNGGVIALDATSGQRLWKFEHKSVPGAVGGEFGVPINRGVALLNDKVYVGTGDARLFALDSADGSVIWNVQVASPDYNYISAAPLAYRDLVATGLGNKGGRGLIIAFDANTGAERWRFLTIPGPGRARQRNVGR